MMFSQWPKSHKIFRQLAIAPKSLRVCADLSELLLDAQTTMLEILYCGSFNIFFQTFSRIFHNIQIDERLVYPFF